jgi:hypothetical protein
MFSRVIGIFGEGAEIIYKSGPTQNPNQPVKGIFANSTVLAGDGMTVSDFVSTFEIKVDDYPTPSKGDSIRFRGEIFKIAEVQKDTGNGLKLILQKDKRLKSVKKK